MKSILILFLAAMSFVSAAERATYDSAGRITGLIHDGQRLEVLGHFVLTMDDGRQAVLQPHDQRSPIQRTEELGWAGSSSEVPGIQFRVGYTESDSGLTLTGEVKTAFPRHVRSVDYVLALPRAAMLGGQIENAGIALPDAKPADPVFHRQTQGALTVRDHANQQRVTIEATPARELTIADTWNALGRWYEIRVPLKQGRWDADETLALQLAVKFEASAPPGRATVTLQPDQPRQEFHGFGANYCWVNTSPVVDYTLKHLRSTWLRFELKFAPWIAERDNPGPLLRRDFELMRHAQASGIPWIVSVWRLPEDFYVPREGGASPMGHGRHIATARWADFLEGIGSYLLYVKEHYGAEPELFSFNEPDLGVDIIFSADEHRDAIRLIGAHFAKLGLKTKLLLGDTANPRDRHLYVLPTAADPTALRYVGGLSFHSWHGATPEQYQAWGDVAEWLQLPLFVGEAGMDPGAYRNRTYDSYTYGLREMKDHFDFIRHARVHASLYWQFTNDYSLVRVDAAGNITPTGRFHLMEHLNNLTPAKSQAYATASDDEDVHALLFRDGANWTIHLLNTGAATHTTLQGVPTAKQWKRVTTSETETLAESTWNPAEGVLSLPARSMVTLIGAL